MTEPDLEDPVSLLGSPFDINLTNFTEKYGELRSEAREQLAGPAGCRAVFKQRPPDVRRSRNGRGVFSRRFYADGDIIGEIRGTVMDSPDYTSPYCYSMGDDRSLEPDAPFKFLNHSCSPNSTFEAYDVKLAANGVERRVFVLALRAIRPGDEITIDYRWPAAMAIRCRCGSVNCRGWIIDEYDLAEFLTVRSAAID